MKRTIFRFAATLLVPAQVVLGLPVAVAASSVETSAHQPPPAPPLRGSANRTLPTVKPPQAGPVFSETPTVAEVFRARIFSEPLVPIGTPTPAETKALSDAILSYTRSPEREDMSSFESFLSENPNSVWRASVLANLGSAYRRTSYFTKGLAAELQAWSLAKGEQGSVAQAVAGIALGELAELHARLGHREELEDLIAEASGRSLTGPATAKVSVARQALAMMVSQPGYSYRCGPLAVGRVLASLGAVTERQTSAINALLSTDRGTNLTQLRQLATKVGLKGHVAFRESPSALPLVPAVVHWKAGHFAAIVRENEGRYLISDPTFGQDTWVSRRALAEEATGYFLAITSQLPQGWRDVGDKEAASVWGKGLPAASDPKPQGSDAPHVGGSEACEGMATYSFNHLLAALRIDDIPAGYEAPRGPSVKFHPTYLQQEQFMPTIPYFSNLGPKWTFDWLSWIEDAPDNPQQTLQHFKRGGGLEELTFDEATATFGPHQISQAVVVRVSVSGDPIRYERRLPDGRVDVYSVPDSAYGVSRRVFLSESRDPQGNTVKFSYDDLYRLVALSDAVGQVTTLAYGHATDPYKVTQVTDPFGRSARIAYDSAGRVVQITDVLNLASQFAYGASDVVVSMTTPYGTTHFVAEESVTPTVDPADPPGSPPFPAIYRSIEATDPLGAKERLEFWALVPDSYGIADPGGPPDPVASVPTEAATHNISLTTGVSLFWDKRAMAVAPPPEGSAAQQTMWAWTTHHGFTTSVPVSTKRPLEARTWFAYQDQAAREVHSIDVPSVVGQVLDDGTLQVTRREYNRIGKVTKQIDPAGRETIYVWGTGSTPDPVPADGSGIDLLQVKQKRAGGETGCDSQSSTGCDLLLAATYNTQAQPCVSPVPSPWMDRRLVCSTTDAAGQLTTYTYTPTGQLATVVTPPRGTLTQGERTSTFEYFPDTDFFGPGRLKKITGPAVTPAPPSLTLAYDGYAHVKKVTDQEGYVVDLTYDTMDRLTRMAYPDGTSEEVVYNRLDAERFRDRLGRWTAVFHDALRRPSTIRDPLGRSTLLDWCGCGSLEKVVDANGNATVWERDVQGRVVKETRADGRASSFTYENTTSRIKQVKDALGQTASFNYFLDDNLSSVTHGGAINPTPNVTLGFDPSYDRLASITDGTGTTSYSYKAITTDPTPGAGRLASVDGPYPSDNLDYDYDELGRVTERDLSGFSYTLSYDALGRITNLVSPVGAFAYSAYLNATSRPLTLTYPNGQTTNYSYLSVADDQRLQQIKHRMPDAGPLLSQFDYTYDFVGNIKTWTQQYGTAAAKVYGLAYDTADQLISATLTTTGTPPTILKRYAFGYDGVGNRTGEQVDAAVVSGGFNARNQLVSRQAGGALRIAGTITEVGKVTVQGKPATVTTGTSTTFEGLAQANPGATVQVVATDNSNNTRTNTYSLAAGGATTLYTYDNSGNLTGDGTRAFEWDAQNRLIRVTSGGPEVARFTYDGFGRRATKVAGGVTTTFVYDGDDIIEERLSTGTTYRYVHGPGIDQPWARQDGSGAVTYYVADHLGSIVQTTNAAAQVTLTREYDPWGNMTQGATTSGYAFTGREWDPETGLYYYRARYYDPKIGRFISEDPIGLGGGINLYGYVSGRPTSWRDPFGLWSPEAHDSMIDSALSGQPGVLNADVSYVKQVSRYFDSQTGLGTEGAEKHSMRRPFQSPEDAIRERDAFIEERLNTAESEADQGYRTAALEALAEAVHAMMDSTSPSHVDKNGQPKVWCGPACSLPHSPNEDLGKERKKDITPEVRKRVNKMLRDAFRRVFCPESR